MKRLADDDRQLAETAARLIEMADSADMPDSPAALGINPIAMDLIALAYIELRASVRALHALVDQTDPKDPIGIALVKAGFTVGPPSVNIPRLIPTTEQLLVMSPAELLALYCGIMGEVASAFGTHPAYIVRLWDGMDGCWTDCTIDVSLETALRLWADRTDGGAHHVAYAEIDYYRIFPIGTKMKWDGSKGREMNRP